MEDISTEGAKTLVELAFSWVPRTGEETVWRTRRVWHTRDTETGSGNTNCSVAGIDIIG
jgi:hypothetical protein